jgi:GH24 family phage-related lysozyme (muramidase)
MRLSDAGLAELRRTEGVIPQVYDDATGRVVSSWEQVKGFPTIALGRLIQPGDRARFARYLGGREKLVGAELDAVIRDTIEPRERQLTALITSPTLPGQFDALFSMMFNTGAGNKTFRAALAAHNAGDDVQAARLIAAGTVTSKGKVVAGLVKRRAREAAAYASAARQAIGANKLPLVSILVAVAAGYVAIRWWRSRHPPRLP